MDSTLVASRTALADWDYYKRPLEVVLRRQRVGKFQKYDAAWARQQIRSEAFKVVDLYHEGERCGFMLLMIDRSGLVPSCLLWFGYMERSGPPSETAWPELRRWAKRFRCPIVEFVSSRPGLFKKAPKHGWEEAYRGFAAEV